MTYPGAPITPMTKSELRFTKRCRSEYWAMAGCFDFVLQCERGSGHKGLHRARRPPRMSAVFKDDIKWRRGGPPKDDHNPKLDPKPFDIDELVRELNEERQVGCVRYTPEGLVIRPEPRRKLYRKAKP